MLRYAEERDKANRILDLTSLTVEEFEQVVAPFETAFVHHMDAWTMEGLPRTGRRYSQDASCPLPTPEDRLLFILVYLKVASLQVAHGALFGMTQSNANKWIHVLLPMLHQTLADLGDMPARHLAALRERLATLVVGTNADAPPPFYHDGSERPISRPKDADEQKACYSDKKKRHTVKNVFFADDTATVQFVSDTYEGGVHDKAIADATPYPLPEGSELLQDLGLQGFTLAGVTITQPHKKPRGKQLTAAAKAENTVIARRRVPIEHVIASIKRCRILKEPLRLWKEGVRDMVIAIGAALHNLRVRLNPWPTFV